MRSLLDLLAFLGAGVPCLSLVRGLLKERAFLTVVASELFFQEVEFCLLDLAHVLGDDDRAC